MAIHEKGSWWGACRLVACGANVAMIVGMYLEYLWAADWPEIPVHCEERSSLPWLNFCDCFHRYTFSHAMLRGQNLTIFALVGACVAACFVVVEHRRIGCLQSLLEARLRNVMIGRAEERVAVQRALRYLGIYSVLIQSAFCGVLLLVPFNLERPLMHYCSTALVVSSMLTGVCIYVAMPLCTAAGHENSDASDELAMWAQRHQVLRKNAWMVIALHFILPATAAVHHYAWLDATGRLFGACEVSAILSYQIFVALFAKDDFAVLSQKAHEATGEFQKNSCLAGQLNRTCSERDLQT
mmetsp:Transcript_14387/g.25299  ORF Transcript_14387/g.25299 Transcript_14387/m.25299 type:complete len:297 (+) Transcript_14387:38-928(+)